MREEDKLLMSSNFILSLLDKNSASGSSKDISFLRERVIVARCSPNSASSLPELEVLRLLFRVELEWGLGEVELKLELELELGRPRAGEGGR